MTVIMVLWRICHLTVGNYRCYFSINKFKMEGNYILQLKSFKCKNNHRKGYLCNVIAHYSQYYTKDANIIICEIARVGLFQ